MRLAFSVIFSAMIFVLLLCAVSAKRSHKAIGNAAAWFEVSIIPPVAGNLIIISTQNRNIAIIGYYIFFLGMNNLMFSLTRFSKKYCKMVKNGREIPKAVDILLIIDSIQILLNPLHKHTFTVQKGIVDGLTYYRLVPLIGQTFHRIVDYGIFLATVLIYIVMIVRSPRIYREKFWVILVPLIIAGGWQLFYILSRAPIDTSMIGFSVFGMLVYIFSIHYRPLRLLDRMLSEIVSEMSDAMFVFDPTRTCIWANEKGCELAEITPLCFDEATAKLTDIFGDLEPVYEQDSVKRIIGTGREIRYYILEENKVTDSDSKLTGSYMRIHDVTEEQLRLKQEMYDATHDILTGLYTREYLYQRISEKLTADPDKEYLIIYVDVKNFKVVNDIFGTAFGNYAIKCIADWIRKGMTDDCRYGRLAGDTFGVLAPKDQFNVEKIEAMLSRFTIKGEKAEYNLLIHCGVYKIDKADTDISVMFDRAHLSLSLISDEYHTHIAFYDNAIREKLMWNQNISAQLPDAIETGQIRPYLQPIADKNGKIVGAEALVRWIHPEHGFLSPAAFIPLFEKNGLIEEVDKHMWRSACKILARWKNEKRDLFISVNISPKDFYFVDVIGEITSLVNEYGIEPSKLRIEITETAMMNDADSRMKTLQAFRDAGFIVEMDDFGSGYSSLNMLKDMPVDVLKIDMKFLGKSDDEKKAHTIVKNIINLSKELGISTLTEGVETQIQYEVLSDMGCKLFQGYYFAKPMPVNEFEEKMLEEAQTA